MSDRAVKDLLLAAYAALPLPLITLVVHWNPSGAPPLSPFPGPWAAAGLAAALGLGSLAAVLAVLGARSARTLVATLGGWTAGSLAVAVVLAATLHRDYYSHTFQVPLMAWIIVSRRIDVFRPPQNRARLFGYLAAFNLVVFIFTGVWTVLMGYAIVTRAEPRWAESILYNGYNVVFIFLLALTTIPLLERRRRTVLVTDRELHIDRYDFSNYFTGSAGILVRAFLLSQGRVIRCRELAALEAGDETPADTDTCADCVAQGWKATHCKKYRNTYNTALEIRRILETLEIGTIVAPADRRKVKEEGWRFRLFDGVRVVDSVRGRG